MSNSKLVVWVKGAGHNVGTCERDDILKLVREPNKTYGKIHFHSVNF